jgi:hypothetical protein
MFLGACECITVGALRVLSRRCRWLSKAYITKAALLPAGCAEALPDPAIFSLS